MEGDLFWVNVVHIRVVIIKFTLIFHGTAREEEKKASEREEGGRERGRERGREGGRGERERERERDVEWHGRSSCFSPELWNYLWLQSICRTSRGISGNCFKRVIARPLLKFTDWVTSCHNKNVDIVRDSTTAVRDCCELTRMIGRRAWQIDISSQNDFRQLQESYA